MVKLKKKISKRTKKIKRMRIEIDKKKTML